MPSAEKSTSGAPLKAEVIQVVEPKLSEASQMKEGEMNNGDGKNLSHIQQSVQLIQNKIRNLEKRKNKLDGYIKEEESGKELSSEQKKAVQKYDEVVNQLGISKEYLKQIQTIATVASKEAKREAKKAQFIRQVQETSKVREVIIVQDILRQLKNERIRNDFLQGSNGACLIDNEEMNVLEQFSKFTVPIHPNFSNEPSFVNSAKSAADHLSFLVDGRTRQFMESGFNYEKIKELFNRIQTCGYWEKDIKIVEAQPAETIISSATQERPAESETPQSSDDLESKEDKIEETMSKGNNNLPPAPLPTQVPNPLFNGNVGMIPPQAGVPMHMMASHPQKQPPPPAQQPTQAQQQLQMKPVTAVENAFFNQMKYSQGPMIGPVVGGSGAAVVKGPAENNNPPPPNRFIEDFSTSSISFLQDSLVEQQNQQQQQVQQKMPTNFVSQPKPSPVQSQQQPQPLAQSHQAISTFHHQQPTSQTHHFPPGLKVAAASNIPVNFTQQASQQTQQAQPSSHLIQPQAYPPQPPQQYQQKMPTNIPNLQDIEQKTNTAHPQQQASSHDLSDRTAQRNDMNEVNKEKSRNSNEWNAGNNQQQPQIDTWTNETSMGNNQSGNGNYSRYHRGDRGGRGTGASGNGGGVERGSKFNNYRGSDRQQQSRNNFNNENGGGGDGNPSTFFRNNERYSGGNRYNNGGNNANNTNTSGGGERGGFNKQRDSNYRAGSGRFVSGSIAASNAAHPLQRK